MLDPEEARAWLEHHFATVTPEEFIANVRRSDPEFAQDLWGTLSAAEILARPNPSRLGGWDVLGHDSAAPLPGSGKGAVIDPEAARAVVREYHATATDQQIVDDLRRFSPELARRLGVDAAPGLRPPDVAARKLRGFFSSLGRTVLKLFS
jgi:hypothetical protein